ncbi:hypothetical protein [Haloterrigena salinisoli]|uniref:hypothetical protein n=1 Tax=Haloterrigena salinisoli TaxID=3132747 RepID=UPI0030CCADDD
MTGELPIEKDADDFARNYCYFVPGRIDRSKRPGEVYGGYPGNPVAEDKEEMFPDRDVYPEFSENDNVYSGEQMYESKYDKYDIYFCLLGGKLEYQGETYYSLVLDYDFYKIEDESKRRTYENHDFVRQGGMVVESQSGGKHQYFLTKDPDILEGLKAAEHVDLKGFVAGGFTLWWGNTDDYNLISDNFPLVVDREDLLRTPFVEEKPDRKNRGADVPEISRKKTIEMKETSDIKELFAAINNVKLSDVNLDLPEHPDYGAPVYDPSFYRTTGGSDSFEWDPGINAFWDRKGQTTTYRVFDIFRVVADYVDHPDESIYGSQFFEAVEEFRKSGAPIPEYTDEFGVEKCEPPGFEKRKWTGGDEIREEEIPNFVKNAGEKTRLLSYDPGIGKTYTTTKTALENEIPFVIYFENHTKAKEHYDLMRDKFGVEPLYLRGITQPGMCELVSEHEDEFRELSQHFKHGKSHLILEDRHGDCNCQWKRQFDKIDVADYIIAPNAYLGYEDLTGRLQIIDESGIIGIEKERYGKNDLRDYRDFIQDEMEYPSIVQHINDLIDLIRGETVTPEWKLGKWDTYRAKLDISTRVKELAREGDYHDDLTNAILSHAGFEGGKVAGDEIILNGGCQEFEHYQRVIKPTEEEEGIKVVKQPTYLHSAEIRQKEGNFPGGLFHKRIPTYKYLNPIILDATPNINLIERQFGEFDQIGDDTFECENLTVIQITDGMYHPGTISQSDGLQERIQVLLDAAPPNMLHVASKDHLSTFDFPGESVHYHGLRGLNKKEKDGVILVGAPHPRIDDLRQQAEMFTDQDFAEYSERESNPRYEKYNFTDSDGIGRKAPTKQFDGLFGFWENLTTDEMKQAIHRIRPITSEKEQIAVIISNVPLPVEVDHLVTWDDILDKNSDEAIELFDHFRGETVTSSELLNKPGLADDTIRYHRRQLESAGYVENLGKKSFEKPEREYEFKDIDISPINVNLPLE